MTKATTAEKRALILLGADMETSKAGEAGKEKWRMGKEAKRTAGEAGAGGLLVTSAEAARMVGMGVRGFRRAVKRTGTLKKHPASGKFRHLYTREKVLAWAEEETGENTGGNAR